MKKNKNLGLMNNSNQSDIIQKHLFREVEKRYDIKVNDVVLIGPYNMICKFYILENSIIDCITEKDYWDSQNIGELPLTTYNEIYKLTDSGYYSYNNRFNIIFSEEKFQIVLIPIITISRGSGEISFWMNDKFLRDLFYDTELIMNGDKESPNKTIIEIEKGLNKKYNKQLIRLNKLFSK